MARVAKAPLLRFLAKAFFRRASRLLPLAIRLGL